MAKVISGFKCPYTKRIYHVGDEYNDEHLEEMRAKGYVEGAENELKPVNFKGTKSKKSKE